MDYKRMLIPEFMISQVRVMVQGGAGRTYTVFLHEKCHHYRGSPLHFVQRRPPYDFICGGGKTH